MLIISVLTQQPWILVHHHRLNPLHANYPTNTHAPLHACPNTHTHTHTVCCGVVMGEAHYQQWTRRRGPLDSRVMLYTYSILHFNWLIPAQRRLNMGNLCAPRTTSPIHYQGQRVTLGADITLILNSPRQKTPYSHMKQPAAVNWILRSPHQRRYYSHIKQITDITPILNRLQTLLSC